MKTGFRFCFVFFQKERNQRCMSSLNFYMDFSGLILLVYIASLF